MIIALLEKSGFRIKAARVMHQHAGGHGVQHLAQRRAGGQQASQQHPRPLAAGHFQHAARLETGETHAGQAGLRDLKSGKIPKGSTIVCTLTGNGMKDPDIILKGGIPELIEVDAVRSAVERVLVDRL